MIDSKAQKENLSGADLNTYSKEEWARALEVREAILHLLHLSKITESDVEEAAAGLNISRSWLYELINRFRNEGTVSCLIPRKPTGGRGKGRINSVHEALINEIVETTYLTTLKLKPSKVIKAYKTACKRRNLKPVSDNTVRARLQEIPARLAMKRRESGRKARDKFDPVVDEFPRPKWPLGVVQMDHTPTDIIVVDEELRQPIGKLNLTIAVDIYSRAILGYLMSLEAPSATTVALCLAHAVAPKAVWLRERGIHADWPMYGKMDVLHVDNGPDFKSEALKRGCDQHGIVLEHRPVKHPKYGGTVERLFETLNEEIHSWHGTTKSNVQDKGEYNSEEESCLTMAELERMLVRVITKIYHEEIHSKLLISPKLAWDEGIYGVDNKPGRGLPTRIPNEKRFLIDFLPLKHRTIQRYGFVWDYIHYYDPVLRTYLDREDKRKFIIRRDPRDLSKVYFYCPETDQYFEIPYRNLDNPSVTLWEWTATRERLKQKGLDARDEDTIFEAYEENRRELEEARIKTKRARRQYERTKQAKRSRKRLTPQADQKSTRSLQDKPSVQESISPEEDDFDFGATFDDIKLR
ncbi:Mu transposase C-terminal domain-containing protein [Kordiimonas lipolytica]|uniref:Mu transposase C-terminal domain-containing protein n=1 Tax=Kordiimonas lipolytica TaxID=1662421 RepID=A0ABV8UFG0_9PROT|nr:Mu transposase C-terminal domain-containing protein [Kordiimonas lipolytica]